MNDEARFVNTYVALSLAKERFEGFPDSTREAYISIFKKYDTDSTWMDNFAHRTARQIGTSERLWQAVLARLDSLRKSTTPDTIFAD